MEKVFSHQETLGNGVSQVGIVWRPVVQHRLIYGIGGFVGEDAGWETGDQLLDAVNAAALHDVVVNQHVLAEKLHFPGTVSGDEWWYNVNMFNAPQN